MRSRLFAVVVATASLVVGCASTPSPPPGLAQRADVANDDLDQATDDKRAAAAESE